MPEIKVKHVVSFSSEDKVYKAENLLKPESFRKWKCGTPGESKASVILQFEKSSTIHSIDVGNEHSAFVEVLVGRASNASNDYKVLLAASSFMSPLESRNGNNTNRVRMFSSEKFVQNVKDEKWDCIQFVCTQPYNKNIQYGLSFVKIHSPPDPSAELKQSSSESRQKLGGFKLKDEEENNNVTVGSWFLKRKDTSTTSPPSNSPAAIRQASSFAATVLASSEKKRSETTQVVNQKRKHSSDDDSSTLPTPSRRKESTITHVNREKVGYKTIQSDDSSGGQSLVQSKTQALHKTPPSTKYSTSSQQQKTPAAQLANKQQTPVAKRSGGRAAKKVPFNKIMAKVVFALSGFQNPLRGEIRDHGVEMGAKYKSDWDESCSHLVCAFLNTPKFIHVQSKGGRIVKKEWILESHKQKVLLPWRRYMLGKYSGNTTEEESSEDEQSPVTSTKKDSSARRKFNGDANKPSSSKRLDFSSKDQSSSSSKEKPLHDSDNDEDNDEDFDDTDADEDYKAATDVDSSSSSGGDTEDEIRRVEKKIQKQKPSRVKKQVASLSDSSTDDDLSIIDGAPSVKEPSPPNNKLLKLDTSDLSLPPLPDFFKRRKFFLYGDFPSAEKHRLVRYITAYNGEVCDYMNADVRYVITQSKWNDDFEEALGENDNLNFVQPQWIYKCKEKGKLVPFQPYVIVPTS